MKRPVVSVVILGLCLFAGCISIRSDVSLEPSDPAAASAQARQVRPGKTTVDELVFLLGTPTHRQADADGVETWSYRYTKNSDGHFALFPFITIKDKKESTLVLQFEVQDGVVAASHRKTNE